MPQLGAVLDTCVLYSAPLRDTLLRAAAAGLYTPFWSIDILDELRRSLVEDARRTTVQADNLIAAMQEAFPDAMVTGHERHVPTMQNHPKDRHVLAAAVEAKAVNVVTFNLKDFTPEKLANPATDANHMLEF